MTSASRPPAPTIFIGNIPYDLTEDALVEIFEEVGPVKSFRLVNDRDTGMAKGYGFCEYYDTTTAESAVRNLNNHEINGRAIRVDFADEHVTKPSTPKHPVDRERPKEDIPAKEMPVGMDAVCKAACKMAFLLGGRDVVLNASPPSSGTNYQIYKMLAEMQRKEMYEVLAGMKDVVQRNYSHAKTMLIQNPQLSRTLFLMEIVLGVVEAPDLPDQSKDPRRDFDDLDMTEANAAPNFASLVVNPPPPPMQPLTAFEGATPPNQQQQQQPMTNYQSVVQTPTMFAAANLSGMNIQALPPTLGVLTGNQQSGGTWPATMSAGFPVAFNAQEHTPMVAQTFTGLVPGMQVLAQQPGGTQLVSGMMGSQNHVLLNQQLLGQQQTPIVPMGSLQQGGNEGEMVSASQATQTPTSPEAETMLVGDGLDDQTKSQINQIMSLTEDQLAALPPEHRDQALAIRQQFGKIT